MPATNEYGMEKAARRVLYEVWRHFGDQYFAPLQGTWAGKVLVQMQVHYHDRQDRRRIHDARQGVKMRPLGRGRIFADQVRSHSVTVRLEAATAGG